jgi:acetylornithine deacetylase/succinyl-diaminopimelate desuccinylase-like protein
MRPDVMQAITQTTRELFGDVPVIPMMLAGGTDSRFFRARGVDAYGVSGLFVDGDTDSRIHGRDERIPIKGFFEGQEFLYRLTQRLATVPAVVP